MIEILDNDAGNIKSVERAFQHLGVDTIVTRNPEDIYRAERVVLPGVGSFGDAMGKLNQYGLIPVIHQVIEKEVPFIGICLGLQLLFESSDETPGVPGLGICKGQIKRIPDAPDLKVPHVGWNSLSYPSEGKLYKGIPENSYVYFVHSYYLEATDRAIVKARTQYGVDIDASIEQGNVFACQFHPEKSSDVGMQILDNFLHV